MKALVTTGTLLDRGAQVTGLDYNVNHGVPATSLRYFTVYGPRQRPAQKGDMRDTFADTALARADLGFAPTASLEEGIEAEYRWLSTTPALR